MNHIEFLSWLDIFSIVFPIHTKWNLKGIIMAIVNQADFHTSIHNNIGSPTAKYVTSGNHKNRRRRKVPKVHANEWAESIVNLKTKNITVNVYIDFQQNSLSNTDYIKLKSLASLGINHFWSRTIKLSSDNFNVTVTAKNRKSHSIDVDLYIETDKDYARSHNSGLIDASFKYNKGAYRGMNAMADRDFMLVSAHEFGHSVLEYFGDSDLSWTHKGSTNKYLQNVKSSTPGYPSAGEIDLMKYYDGSKNLVTPSDRNRRTRADELDLKRLVWMSSLTFIA